MNKIYTNLFVSLFITLLPIISKAEIKSEKMSPELSSLLFTQLTKENSVKHNRVTREGELSACEIVFQYVYRDYRAQKGEPILLTGSFSASWTAGKNPGFMYKINAHEPNLDKGTWSTSAPSFINIAVGKLNFKPFKNIDFICESGGRCVGFEDPKFSINLAVEKKIPFDASLSWSLTTSGMDNSVNLTQIGQPAETKIALRSFESCNAEIIQNLSQYLKENK